MLRPDKPRPGVLFFRRLMFRALSRYYGANATSALTTPAPHSAHATLIQALPQASAVAYLIRLHADIGGRILDNKREAERLRRSRSRP